MDTSVTLLQCDNSDDARNILRGSKITALTSEDYCSHQLGDFVLEIGSMMRFDESRMMVASILPNLSIFDIKLPQIEG